MCHASESDCTGMLLHRFFANHQSLLVLRMSLPACCIFINARTLGDFIEHSASYAYVSSNCGCIGSSLSINDFACCFRTTCGLNVRAKSIHFMLLQRSSCNTAHTHHGNTCNPQDSQCLTTTFHSQTLYDCAKDGTES